MQRGASKIVPYAAGLAAQTDAYVNNAQEAEVNKLACTLVTASVLVGGSAYGQNKPKTTNDKPAKQALRDSQMDKVTAAGEENSSIAANNSTVTENNSGTVSLAGSVLSGASGINIVNSTDSLVANGVNVYDTSATSGKGSDVTQGNVIDQSENATATLGSYHRGENSQLTLSKSSNVSKSSSSSSSLNASLNTSTTDTFAKSNDLSKTASLTDTYSNVKSAAATLNAAENSSHNSNSTAAADATANNSTAATGGSASTTGSSTSSNSASSGGSTSSNTGSAMSTTKAANGGSATNATGDIASTNTTASTNAATLGATLNLASNKSNSLDATSSLTHNKSVSNDFSTSLATTLATTASDMKSFTSAKTKSVTKDIQGAVAVDDADATNIAVDGSTISDTNTYSVSLAGSAEANAKAINIVNAAGGMVANGVNVAHSTGMNPVPTLSQVNSITQSH